jgi:chloride channel protein, CIC family
LTSKSRIEAKVAILKPISAAIAIGTGGPFGAEGPIIETGGAFGSVIGQIISTTAAEGKALLAAGAAAGMAATFNTPIAGVILAIELLLFEFRARSFIPLEIASTLATSVRYQLLGQHSMFSTGNTDFSVPYGLPFYLLLGLLCGATAIGFTKLLYWVEDQFDRLPIDNLWHPAIGALALGIIGPSESSRGQFSGIIPCADNLAAFENTSPADTALADRRKSRRFMPVTVGRDFLSGFSAVPKYK